MNFCPECGLILEPASTTCECGWYLKSEPDVEYKKPFVPEQKLADVLAKIRKPHNSQWWATDKVETVSQVQHIVRQAQHFGPLSPAHRFLEDCIEAGVITADYQLA